MIKIIILMIVIVFVVIFVIKVFTILISGSQPTNNNITIRNHLIM